ncbi:MAG: hypothetical protein JNK29_02970 [Anaerolineales bacterium]|nr:hypothetical protein [Anaerolineales bacterium]
MSDSNTGPPGPNARERYAIRIKGHLDPRWAEWFDGLTLTPEPAGTTLLEGPLADQAALHGVLTKLRDLGLPIISIQSLDTNQ